MAAKRGSIIEDVDGNTYRRPRQRLGRHPARRHPRAGARRRRRGAPPLRHGDHELHPEPAGDRARRAADRARAARSHPVRAEHERHAGGRGRRRFAREATGRPIILGLPGQYHGEGTYMTAAQSTDLSEVPSGSAAVRARACVRAVPQPVPDAVPPRPRPVRRHPDARLRRGLAARAPGRARPDRRRADRAGADRGRRACAVGRVLGAADGCAAARAGC